MQRLRPIALGRLVVVIAIAALAAGFVIAYKKSSTFRAIVSAALSGVKDAMVALKDAAVAVWHGIDTAYNGIKHAISAVVGVVENVVSEFKQHWQLILAILTGPFGAAAIFISKHFDTIVGWVTSMPGRIRSAASGMWDGIKDAFREAIDWIIRGWDSLRFGIPKINTHIPGIGTIGGGTFGVPYIQPLATGGVVTKPTIALVGEAGPEAVIPLNRLRTGSVSSDQLLAEQRRTNALLLQIANNMGGDVAEAVAHLIGKHPASMNNRQVKVLIRDQNRYARTIGKS
jgi:hypothetical protein